MSDSTPVHPAAPSAAPSAADPAPGLARLLALRPALLLGGGGLVALSLLGLFAGGAAWFTAYLIAWCCWAGVAIGSLAVVMIHWLAGGEWGLPVRRSAEAATLTLPLAALGFLPVVFGAHWLYPWGRGDMMAASEVLRHQQVWMNLWFVLIRGLVYFAIWYVLALVLARGSLRYDVAKDQRVADRMRAVSAGGMVVLVLTTSLASVDWLMVRQADFVSTIWGFLVGVGWTLSAFCFVVAVMPLVWARGQWDEVVRPPRRIDLGNLILTCVILWAYMSFMQFLIIWMGNTQKNAAWYVARGLGEVPSKWLWCAAALILLEFFVPFFYLLLRPAKLRLATLSGLAVGLLLISRPLDTTWLAGPSSVPGAWGAWDVLLVPVLFAGVGVVWLATWATLAAGRPMEFLTVDRPLSDFAKAREEGRGEGDVASPLS